MANMSVERAVKESVRIAKVQVRADMNLEQRFLRPGDHLWEVVNANMKFRIRFDEMTVDYQQAFIASGKSRFCAGEKFYKHHPDPNERPRGKLRDGGAQEFLHEHDDVLSEMGREVNETLRIFHNKIFIVGVLVDEIERECPWSTESRENLLYFKQKTGKTPQFMKMWIESLGDLLKQQKITLHQLMNAEMKNERSTHDKRVTVAEILRKPDTAMTAEDTKGIAARVVAEEMPSGSSSRPDPAKGAKVEGDASKGVPRAAPAVVRKISKAPPEQPPRREIPPMPRRPTPPIDPPAKWAKGASKGAAEGVPSGFRTGKGKGKGGEKGRVDDGRFRDPLVHLTLVFGTVLLIIRDADTCPRLLPIPGPREMSRLMVRDKSLFAEIYIGTSEKLIGRGANTRMSRLTQRTLNGMTPLGRASLHFLVRMTAIMGEMMTIMREPAVPAAGGPHPSVLPRIGWVGTGLAPHTAILRTIGIDGAMMIGDRTGVSMLGTMMIGIDRTSDPRTDGMRNTSEIGAAGDFQCRYVPFHVTNFNSTVAVVVIVG